MGLEGGFMKWYAAGPNSFGWVNPTNSR